MTDHDYLKKFIFENTPVLGAIVHLDESYQQALAHREYPKVIRRALGELMVAAQLLAASLKFNGNIVLQIQSEGTLKILLAKASDDNFLSATAKFDGTINDKSSLLELLSDNASFIISLHPEKGAIYSGIVEIKGANLAQMLMNYLQTSEQIDSYLHLEANDQIASGILLQRLPDDLSNTEKYQHILLLAQTLRSGELLNINAQELLYRLFHDEDIRLFPTKKLSFACSCSEKRVIEMLFGLGFNEAKTIIQEQGSIEIICEFCGQRYLFDEQEVHKIFRTRHELPLTSKLA